MLLPGHNLVGILPDTLNQLTELIYLELAANRLYGIIPASFGNFTYLTYLMLNENLFSGSLPAVLGNLTNLEYLNLNINYFSGQIPINWKKLNTLQILDLKNNHLTGTIPYIFTYFTSIVSFVLSQNKFSGQIPEFFNDFEYLSDLVIQDNLLTGSIYSSITKMKVLNILSLSGNFLTGKLPDFSLSKNITTIFLFTNYLTGTISSVFNSTSITSIQLRYNLFTGSISNIISNTKALYELSLSHNLLTGTIPAPLGDLPLLGYVDIYMNYLTGTIPSFTQAISLIAIELQYNRLTGTLDEIFNVSQQLYLNTIVLNNNQLTGTLPGNLFSSHSLKVFVVNTNCLQGSLPKELCNAPSLESLVLDGLNSAKQCRALNFAGSYGISNRVYGSIPACLFSLPNITSLHLSGNGLTGNLPNQVSISSSFIDLTLSHNVLTGTIPRQFQERKWYTLDLSYNRLSGTLDNNFASQFFNFSYFSLVYDAGHEVLYNHDIEVSNYFNLTAAKERIALAVFLTNNRLSGKIPPFLRQLGDVSILGTNMFSCKLDGSDLPADDNGSDNYQCGSSAFDVPYYVWLCLVGILGMVGLVVLLRPRWIVRCVGEVTVGGTVRQWLAVDGIVMDKYPALLRFTSLLDFLLRLTGKLTIYIVLVLLPLYCILSTVYGEYTYEYAWSVSASFLSGSVPMALELVFWVLLLCIAIYLTVLYITDMQATAINGMQTARRLISTTLVRISLNHSILIYTIYAVVNLIVVVGVNIAYVYVAIYQPSGLLIFAQVFLSFFKLLWSTVCTSSVLRLTVSSITKRTGEDVSHSEADFASLQVFVVLLNNIAIPCLVVAAISPDCLYNALVQAPTVNSGYIYPYCSLLEDSNCVRTAYQLTVTEYDPPFIYNYQCSSSFITYYAPAFVNLCVISSVLVPAAEYTCYRLRSQASSGSWWYKVLDVVLPGVLSVTPSTNADSTAARKPHYLNVTRAVTGCIMYLGLLMTFGVVFPPLAVAFAVTMFVVVYSAKVKLGRFVCLTSAQGLYQCVEVLERDCEAAGSIPLLLHNSLWMIVTASCWFYTMFLFDALGDAVGLQGAYWVLIVLPMLPVVLYAICVGYERYQQGVVVKGKGEETADIELPATAAPSEQSEGTGNPLMLS